MRSQRKGGRGVGGGRITAASPVTVRARRGKDSFRERGAPMNLRELDNRERDAVSERLAKRSEAPTHKRCTHCGRWLPLEAFAANPKLRSGLNSWCKQCTVKATKRWRRKHRDAINLRRRQAYDRPRQPKLSDDERRARHSARQRERRRANPDEARRRDREQRLRRKTREQGGALTHHEHRIKEVRP